MSWLSARKTCSSTEQLAPAGEPTVGAALQAAQFILSNRIADHPRRCAESLLAHALGTKPLDLYVRSDEPLQTECFERFLELLFRRLAGEPLQYIVGRTDFWSLTILCDSRALIPRPETETLVETALEIVAAGRTEGNSSRTTSPERPGDQLLVADIGTGTGCIAIALATELPRARFYASDISPDALALAARNAALYSLQERITFLEGDIAEPFIRAGLAGRFDLVVSNPPYIAHTEFDSLQREVRDHEPREALFAGQEGLEIIVRLLNETAVLLKAGGYLIFEVGANQASKVRRMAEETGHWQVIRTALDAGGVERVIGLAKLGAT